jgi:2-polyprenyl-6-methoxyphenol hydroxylase-like FAD-dependent oxidoreductase
LENITVIGAGPGGLTFASILHQHGIDVAIYELESSPNARFEGSVLDMHEDSGQLALRKTGLYEAFRKNVIASGDDMRILDKTATVRLQESGNDLRPEIERGTLRDILVKSLPAHMIHWGSKVTKIARLENGGYEIILQNGEIITTKLLIGADGAWSKVRPLVSNAQPYYLGVSFAETHFLDVEKRRPEVASLVGRGSMMALSDEKGLITHRDGSGKINVFVALKIPDPRMATDGIDFTNTEAAKFYLLKQFTDWNEKLQALIVESDTPFVQRGLYTLPIGHRWKRSPGVTLIGDAAHLMSPFAGEGANLAMLDGLDLAEAILAYPNDMETALSIYEEKSYPRSKAAAAESVDNLNMAFSSDGLQRMVDFMSHMGLPN